MTPFQTILAIIALVVGGILLFLMLITFVADMRTRRTQARQAIAAEKREIAAEKRAEERHEQQLIVDANIVEMLRTVSEQGQEGAKVWRALLGFIQEQGAGQRKHFEHSIEEFFRAHKHREKIMKKIDEQHTETRKHIEKGLGKRGLGR